MRSIVTHKSPGLNDALNIVTVDQPAAGEANHRYEIHMRCDGFFQVCEINFQDGPVREVGVNGISEEALLAIVKDRLESFLAGPYPAGDNATALFHVGAAIDALHARTADRTARGVEGTNQV